MRLYPAIDIKDGKCVRLKKGLFNEVTVYSYKPEDIADSSLKLRELNLYIQSIWTEL